MSMYKHTYVNYWTTILVLLSILVFSLQNVNAQNRTDYVTKNYETSAWVAYDSVVAHINRGDVELAELELKRIVGGLNTGKFIECSNEHSLRLLQYKAHIILANIAFAKKNKNDLYEELSFFDKADTSKTEWKRAKFAATHFKHKHYQLSKGKFGKVVGDWISVWHNFFNGTPMIWIRVYETNNILHAELKECALKEMLNTKYGNFTVNIAVDNVKDIVEINFGDSKLIPGLQCLPSAAIKSIHKTNDMLSESIARKSTVKYGTPYSNNAMKQQLAVDLSTVAADLLLASLSVSKETVTSESFVMEQIAPEIYMAKINFRELTMWSDGRYKDIFNWADIPVIHLYPQEQKDFSNKHFKQSITETFELVRDELWWEDSEENDKIAESILYDLVYSSAGVYNVENTRFKNRFLFLGKNINKNFTTSFSGLAFTFDIWGAKSCPVNPITNKSEINGKIIPLRGVFKTIISSTECITFTGDWYYSTNCGNGLLCYVNTESPELSFSYEGTIMKGYPHGLGIWQGNGYRYVGWFYKGKKIGYGTMTYDDGTEEQGFTTKEGYLIADSLVNDKMKSDFNRKVNSISKQQYQVLNE